MKALVRSRGAADNIVMSVDYDRSTIADGVMTFWRGLAAVYTVSTTSLIDVRPGTDGETRKRAGAAWLPRR